MVGNARDEANQLHSRGPLRQDCAKAFSGAECDADRAWLIGFAPIIPFTSPRLNLPRAENSSAYEGRNRSARRPFQA